MSLTDPNGASQAQRTTSDLEFPVQNEETAGRVPEGAKASAAPGDTPGAHDGIAPCGDPDGQAAASTSESQPKSIRASGDEAARTMVRLRRDVERDVERILGGDPEAADVIQDCLVAIWMAYPVLRNPRAERAFARVVARNAALDHLERRSRRRRLGGILATVAEPVASPAACEPSLLIAVFGLPPEQRAALLQRLVEGRKFREIAEEAGVPTPTIVSRLRLALRHLRSELKDRHRGRE